MAGIALPAGAQSVPAAAPATAGTTTVTLSSPTKQGPTGVAQLSQQGSDVVVTIHGLQDQTSAALLRGKCTSGPKPDITGPAQGLKPLVNGSSETTLPNTTVAALASTPHAIIVQGGSNPLLCGDVSAIAAQAPPH
jgi:hypothetical protein